MVFLPFRVSPLNVVPGGVAPPFPDRPHTTPFSSIVLREGLHLPPANREIVLLFIIAKKSESQGPVGAVPQAPPGGNVPVEYLNARRRVSWFQFSKGCDTNLFSLRSPPLRSFFYPAGEFSRIRKRL